MEAMMLAKAAVVQNGKEKVAATGDVSKPGDLEYLMAAALQKARLSGVDLWNFTVQVTKHT